MTQFEGMDVAYIEFSIKDDAYALLDPYERLITILRREEYLKYPQLQTVGNSHGRYWNPSPSLRGSPVGQSSGNPNRGASVPIGTLQVYTGAGWTIVSFHGTPESDHPVIDCGIRAGEVTGKRCWWQIHQRLFSIYMTECEWLANIPMTGDVDKGFGVHAFKYISDCNDYIAQALFNNGHVGTGLVPGTVSMWGEIVEHERGYRAQYAKITSLDTDDRQLRMKYGV